MSHADEFYRVSSGALKVARKAHRCDACRETIQPGHTYYRHAGLLYGEWDHTKQCLRCHAMFEAISARSRDPVLFTLDCGTSWEDAFGEPCPTEVEALAFTLPGDLAHAEAKAQRSTNQ